MSSKEPIVIADLSAAVFRRVLAFAPVNEIRYYLCGVHVVPGKVVLLEGTNGHMIYVEEDTSGTAQRDLIVNIGMRGRNLLRGDNRVKVHDDGSVRITTLSGGTTLYIEPGTGVIDAKYPEIEKVIGPMDGWHEGFGASLNVEYLKKALAIPGYIRFFSRKDDQGKYDHKGAVMFMMDGGTVNGGKAFGLIMPIRGNFAPDSAVDDMLPAGLVKGRPQRVAA